MKHSIGPHGVWRIHLAMLRPVAENAINKKGVLKTIDKRSFMSGKPHEEDKLRAFIVTY